VIKRPFGQGFLCSEAAICQEEHMRRNERQEYPSHGLVVDAGLIFAKP
jgi:hypothetical protein